VVALKASEDRNLVIRESGRQSEESLEMAESSLALALEAANLGVWELDPATMEMKRNARHDQLWGYADMEAQWTPEKGKQRLVDEDKAGYEAAFGGLEESGKIRWEGRIRQQDGGIRWIGITGRLFYNSQGKPLRAAGVISDITEQRAGAS
jgi:PAS domain-containing protein